MFVPDTVEGCTVDNVTTSSILDLLFGFDLSCKEGEECRPPNIGTMLHAVGNYTWDSKQDVRGIKTDMFKSKWNVAEFDAVVEVRYFWSDRDVWTGTSGTHRSVPVRFEMGGEFLDPLTNQTKFIDESIDFMSFLEVKILSSAWELISRAPGPTRARGFPASPGHVL